MTVIAWITEDAWASSVDAARAWAPAGTDVVLLHVTDDEPAEVAHGAFLGLLGRGRRPPEDPGDAVEAASAAAATQLLEAAAARLGRPAVRMQLSGRVEHEVVGAAAGADLLICARDGTPDRPGPHSLGPVTRFVVDHAPCPVLLVWPEGAPAAATVPPPPR